MQIKELRLSGFKSFVDPVRMPIELGLTGIVGPNGCGKSNLLESVRWVMGVNSPKAMRGGEMDDVIFSGSERRPAREHAEVTLVLDNEGGRAPPPFAHEDMLEVTRRIRRDAGSAYRINSTEVRAKDVQLLFADASTGANSPALVRQGQISELIAAKPENRRRVLEEAAGIGGLQARRHEADLKLKAAEANLARLDEIVAEVEALAASLRKQARQAERYRALAEDLRRIEALLFHRRHEDAQVQAAAVDRERRTAARGVAEAAEKASVAQRIVLEAQEKLAPAREEELVAVAVLRRLEGVRVGLERDLKDAEEKIARLDAEAARFDEDRRREERHAADAEGALARLARASAALAPEGGGEAPIEAARARHDAADMARKEAEATLESIAAAHAAARAQADALQRAAAQARARLARAEEQLAALMRERAKLAPAGEEAARADAMQDTLAAAEAKAQGAESARAAAETDLSNAERAERAAFDPMRAAEARAGEIAAEVRALEKLNAEAAGKDFPPALNQIKARPGYERAVGAALGEDAEAALDPAAPARWGGAAAPGNVSWPDGAEPLSRFLEAPAPLAARLALCAVVDRARGPSLAAALKPGMRLVSCEGDLWRWDGLVREASAAPRAAAARLEARNRLEKAKTDRAAAEAAMLAAQRKYEEARAQRDRAQAELKSARETALASARAALDARNENDRLAAETARAALRLSALDAQEAAATSERDEAQSALRRAEADARAQQGAIGEQTELESARRAAEGARNAAAEARVALAGLLREREAIAERREAIRAETEQWRARAAAARSRLDEIAAGRERLDAARAEARAAPQRASEALSRLHQEMEAGEARRASAAETLAAAEAREREAARAARTAEALHAQERETRAGAEARFEAAQTRLADLAAQIRDQLGCGPEDLARRAGDLMVGPLASGPLADVERKADRLRAERQAGGAVNLRAEEELQETQARLQTLLEEKADVLSAIAKLRRGISELNAEGRARLMAAFDVVNERFTVLFSTLFEGGEASLRLIPVEEGGQTDPLTAGLEIYACPPGKKLSVLSLMSGGEQALTAAALIFAVFLANPAPLCVLDEVDAPLDDANVERFCNMLDEMRKQTDTRFLVITHNPMTMARMDRLFGVTMAEPGVSQLVSVDLRRATELAA